jgi:hypothetical protein
MTLMSQGKPARTISKGVSCEVEDQQETLYTCPANCRAEVTMLFLVNANGNTTVSATWYDASESASFNILGGKNMTAGEYILLTGATLVLEPGDAIRVTPTAQSAPNIDAMCTVTETFIPVG